MVNEYSNESRDEERGNVITMLDDLINSMTIKQLHARVVKADNDDFYNKFLRSKTFRGERFSEWNAHGFDDDAVIRSLKIHGKTGE